METTKRTEETIGELWDVGRVAGFLGVSRSWVYSAVASGNLPVVRVGSLLRFDPVAMSAWVRGGKVVSVKLPGCREERP
jgi:excisionase family DNA binding protein